MFFLFFFSSTHYSPKYRNEKTQMHLIIFGSLGSVEEGEDQWIFYHNRVLYNFSLQEQGWISMNFVCSQVRCWSSYPWDFQPYGQPNHGHHEQVKASLIFNSHTWEMFFALVNLATLTVNPLTHLLIFLILVHSICKLMKMFIIFWPLNHLPPLPQLLFSPSALPQCDPFKIYPVGLLICRPHTIEDKSNAFFLKAFKS